MTKSKLGEETVYIAYRLQRLMEGSHGRKWRQEVVAGTRRQEPKHRLWKNPALLAFIHGLLSSFSYTTQDRLGGATHSGWGLSMSIIN